MTIRVHDLRWAELVDGLVQRLDAELGFQRVRDAPGQDFARVPIHDGNQIQEPAPHRQICDVRTPNLVGSIQAKAAQQIGVNLVPFGGLAGVGLLVDWHQPHQAHQPADALFVDQVPLVAHVPCHLPNPEERCLKELFINLAHEREVQRRLAFWPVVK